MDLEIKRDWLLVGGPHDGVVVRMAPADTAVIEGATYLSSEIFVLDERYQLGISKEIDAMKLCSHCLAQAIKERGVMPIMRRGVRMFPSFGIGVLS